MMEDSKITELDASTPEYIGFLPDEDDWHDNMVLQT